MKISNSLKENIVFFPKLIFFFLLYLLVTKESIFTFCVLLTLGMIVIIFSNLIKEKREKGVYIAILSFVLILPLSLRIESLPTGYQYISISLIGSILYLNLDKSRIRDLSFFQELIYIFTSFLAPITYLSGPSATIKEISNNKNNLQLLPTSKSIKKESIFLAISGFFRITLGYFLLSKSDQINALNPFIEFNIYFLLSFVVFGFYYFWKYYLLFSGASELCKALLSTIGIDVIDNFKQPELSVFYHEIWGKWHLNITDRIRQYLYTPITLFALRKSSNFKKLIKFLFVEGLPLVTLFLILGIWHGGRPKDFLFGCASTFLVLISRALGRNRSLRISLEKNNFFLEGFRFANLIIFGIVLSIYETPFVIISSNLENYFNTLYFSFFLLILIYTYFRLKNLFSRNKSYESIFLYSSIFEFSTSVVIQLFFINPATVGSEFLYFAN